ncbi:MAG: LPXTG cell wall anchor domain-containing protein [Lachnospiraceae bacterium]|nr:LPXTG cell wall anchor domain-containing protein [Lachnospiraceae bacterium]
MPLLLVFSLLLSTAAPSSGGPGTYLFTIFGAMFLTLVEGYGWSLRKRRGE